MNAAILAAGLGKRLAPLTDQMPKALVLLQGSPLLFHLLQKLYTQGFTQIVVNAHHHQEMMTDFLNWYNRVYNRNVILSIESRLLDTGGGIKRMLGLIDNDRDVLVHNVDILSDINLQDFYHTHTHSQADASLAIMKRQTTRPLLFDKQNRLCGRKDPHSGQYRILTQPVGKISGRAFCGIQVIKPDLFRNYIPDRFYSIDVYLKHVSRNGRIMGIPVDGTYWQDVGTLQDLEKANRQAVRITTAS